jgi:hypothetical protein
MSIRAPQDIGAYIFTYRLSGIEAEKPAYPYFNPPGAESQLSRIGNLKDF